jgi:hypothetical protein
MPGVRGADEGLVESGIARLIGERQESGKDEFLLIRPGQGVVLWLHN